MPDPQTPILSRLWPFERSHFLATSFSFSMDCWLTSILLGGRSRIPLQAADTSRRGVGIPVNLILPCWSSSVARSALTGRLK
jgi:hypothetical protein